jgi:DNA-binding response OmpR family regulator
LGSDFDLVITDIILSGMNGLEFCQEVKAYQPGLPVIMLTALGRTDDKVEGFDAGADDYLVKPFDFRELLARIRALLKRAGGFAQPQVSLVKYADLEINREAKTATRKGQEIQLTPKEFKLLECMVQHAERVLSMAEIAGEVWDTHFDTGTNFIDGYINYLKKN